MIGDCGLTKQLINGQIKPEIGYHIRADHQRKGYATEAAIAVRNWTFSNTPFCVVYSYMKHTNLPSMKTAIAYGCKQVDAFEDEFLSRMMQLLLQVQRVPKIYKYLSKNGAHEDFDEDVHENYNKITFYRKWDHLRTKIGKPVPLTQELMETIPATSGQLTTDSIDLGLVIADTSEEVYHNLLNAFIDTLDNDVDRQIMYMRADGKTQSEIAEALGYANHTPVTKRLQRLKQQYQLFMQGT